MFTVIQERFHRQRALNMGVGESSNLLQTCFAHDQPIHDIHDSIGDILQNLKIPSVGTEELKVF